MQRTFPAWHLERFQAVFPPCIISWGHLNHQVLMCCIKMLFGQGRFAIVSQAVGASHLPRMDLPGSFAPFIKIWKLREGQGQGQGGFLGRLWVPPKILALCICQVRRHCIPGVGWVITFWPCSSGWRRDLSSVKIVPSSTYCTAQLPFLLCAVVEEKLWRPRNCLSNSFI